MPKTQLASPPIKGTTYERPVNARLVVRLENGDEWEATEADMAKFGYKNPLDLYMRAQKLLLEALGVESLRDVDDDYVANDVRYMIECALMYDHSPWANADGEPWTSEDATVDYRERIRSALMQNPDEQDDGQDIERGS